MTITSVYNGNSVSDYTSTNNWLGGNLNTIQLHGGTASWSDWLGSVSWQIDLFKDQPVNILWSIPLIPAGATLADAAAGKYNSNYLAMAQQLLADAGTQDKIYVRLGWEFNGDGWNTSSAVGQPENYAAAFRDFVTVARSVSSKFVFEWCPNVGPTDMNPETAYPGDSYVDIIGTDFYYSTQWDSKDAKTAFDWFVSEPYGLQWQQDFAAAHGKQTAIGEWGLNSDNPEYVKLVADWATSHNMVYQNYWDSNAAFKGELSSGQYPTASAAYQAIFGSRADGHTYSFGTSAADILRGSAAGSTAKEEMFGGDGDDTYYVYNAIDKVFEAVGTVAGVDTVNASISYTLTTNVENLTLMGTANIDGNGNGLDNKLVGNSGVNVLCGGAGGDTLDGGAGADSLLGGDGNDTYYVDNAGDRITEYNNSGLGGVDMVYASASHTLAANVENLTLTGTVNLNATGNSMSNVITGNNGNNIISGGGGSADQLYGGAGDDTLAGGTGADILDGGSGVDSMKGGDGNDKYYVDNSSDQIIEYYNGGSGGIDIVYASASHTLAANVENLTLTGTANLTGTGNALANILIGNSGANVIDGGAGADSMTGGDGNDTYYVDSAGDRITEYNNGGLGGVDTVYASISYALTTSVENLTLTGTANINATGNTQSNIIYGNAGNNLINGGVGADKLFGGAGADTFAINLLSGKKIIGDFAAGDSIDISAYLSQHYTPTISVSGGNTTLTFDANNSIVLLGVTSDHLHATTTGYTYG